MNTFFRFAWLIVAAAAVATAGVVGWEFASPDTYKYYWKESSDEYNWFYLYKVNVETGTAVQYEIVPFDSINAINLSTPETDDQSSGGR